MPRWMREMVTNGGRGRTSGYRRWRCSHEAGCVCYYERLGRGGVLGEGEGGGDGGGGYQR